jgi:aryl-alcohol dehydrogenase (NADP+)
MFGGETEASAAAEIMASSRAAGVNFIDTADSYHLGESERVTGQLIAQDRDAWILATKISNRFGAGVNDGGLNRRWVVAGAEGCLTRLGTDYIDVLYLHREDLETPLQETIRAVADLVRAGKIRYFGVSNHRPWRVALICQLCDEEGIDRPIVMQPCYNLLNRIPENDLIPLALHYGIGVVPYSPLARGVLTGKYQPGVQPGSDTRAGRSDRRMMMTEWRDESLEIAQQIVRYAAERGTTAPILAFNWVLANRGVSSAIGGPRTMAHWQGYLDSLDYQFTQEDEAFLSGFVSEGHTSTPGYNDAEYPIEGRVLRDLPAGSLVQA